MMFCIRCGRESHIEKHHIIQRIHGGSDSPSNLENRCRDCHKYEHAKRDIINKLKGETQWDRVMLLSHRLSVLEELNTVVSIRQYGYRSYWMDETTRLSLPQKQKRDPITQEQMILL